MFINTITFQCSSATSSDDHATCPLSNDNGCSCICHDTLRLAVARERSLGHEYVYRVAQQVRADLGL